MFNEMSYADELAPELGLESAAQWSYGNWAIGNDLEPGSLVFEHRMDL